MIDFSKVTDVILNSFWRILTVIIILFFTVVVSRVIRIILNKAFKKTSKRLKIDETKYQFIKHAVSAAIYLIGIGLAIYAIPSLRAISVSMLAGAGVLAVAIGFASQEAFANIISGIFLAIFKPFSVGDRVTIGNNISGIVEDITLRHTIIKNYQNKRVIIPNTIMSNETIENATIKDEKICKWIDIGISYDSDIDKARKIMIDEALKHPNHFDNRSVDEKSKNDPIVRVRVIGLGDSSVNLRTYVWAKNSAEGFVLACDLNESIKKRFDKEGVTIPFPHRTIVFKDKRARF
ncbi:MAG: mechanosensitive ion channel family protein [Nanoarchaeota archaeon]